MIAPKSRELEFPPTKSFRQQSAVGGQESGIGVPSYKEANFLLFVPVSEILRYKK